MEKIPSYVADTGEVNWLVDDALHVEVGSARSRYLSGRDAALRLARRGEELGAGYSHNASRLRRTRLRSLVKLSSGSAGRGASEDSYTSKRNAQEAERIFVDDRNATL